MLHGNGLLPYMEWWATHPYHVTASEEIGNGGWHKLQLRFLTRVFYLPLIFIPWFFGSYQRHYSVKKTISLCLFHLARPWSLDLSLDNRPRDAKWKYKFKGGFLRPNGVFDATFGWLSPSGHWKQDRRDVKCWFGFILIDRIWFNSWIAISF